MPARLVISAEAYSLLVVQGGGWTEVAALPGGAAALIPSTRAVGEAGLEHAIEVAEDWLMPHAARLRGDSLEVSDSTGRLKAGLHDVLSVGAATWSIEDVEAIFLRLVHLATGRSPSPGVLDRPFFLADVLLLRELAHHGRVRELRIS
jgi:hypothetical protein